MRELEIVISEVAGERLHFHKCLMSLFLMAFSFNFNRFFTNSSTELLSMFVAFGIWIEFEA